MIEKPAYNEEYRLLQFARPDGQGPLAEGETISSATVTVEERATGTDTSATMISNVASYNNTAVRYLLKGGTAGTAYFIRVRCVTSGNQKFEEKLELRVI